MKFGVSTLRSGVTAGTASDGTKAVERDRRGSSHAEEVLGEVVEEAKDRIAAGDDPDAVLDDVRAEAEAVVDRAGARPSAESVTVGEVMDAFARPTFLIGADHELLQYNTGIKRLLGLADDHDEFFGRDNRETIAAASYTDGSRHKSLADKVAKTPRNAEKHWDVERVDADNEWFDGYVYEDTSVLTNTDGEDINAIFWAVPIFDEHDELRAVFEIVEDHTEEIRRRESVQSLVGEVTETLHAIGAGDLAARADFEDEHGVLDSELTELTDDVNAMADSFQDLIEGVDERTGQLAESIERATDSAHRVNRQVTDQTDSIDSVATQLEDFSATMEEVAASSNQVATAAEEALEEADRGVAAGEDAREITDEVREMSEDLVDTVEELDDHMDEVSQIVDVIAEVADQTSMLALNANIEAARAGEAGSGFAVVADEVKTLATETREHTETIGERIEEIQTHADETVSEVETSHERIRVADETFEEVLGSLTAISDQIETAASGVAEVADANEDQATTVEEVMATVDDVREDAHEVSATMEDIVTEAENQEGAVVDLSEQVRELSRGTARTDRHGG